MNTILCPRCNNAGYYEMLIRSPIESQAIGDFTPSQPPQKSMMFCSCENGRKLHAITIEFRLADMEMTSQSILPLLQKIRGELHKPSEAMSDVDELIKQIQETVYKIKNQNQL